MNLTTDPTETAIIPPAPDPPAPPAGDEDGAKRKGLEGVTAERPRTHPIAYLALALSALALLVGIVGLGDGGSDYRQVRVGDKDCVIGRQGDADVLYCRTDALPPP